MSYKISVKDLKKPDKILKALRNFVKLILGNVKYLIFSAVFIVLLSSILAFLNYSKDKKENKASFELYKAMNLFTKDTNNQDKIKAIQNLIPILKNTGAGVQANFELAKTYFAENNFTEAEKHFYIVEKANKKFISESAELLRGVTLQRNNNCQEAVIVFDKILKRNDKITAPVAMWNMASCNIVLNKKDKANEMYDLIKIKYPDSQYAKLAVLAKNNLREDKK